jgi:hypothetical protein
MKNYPWTQEDQTPGMDALANEIGAAREEGAEQETIDELISQYEHACAREMAENLVDNPYSWEW